MCLSLETGSKILGYFQSIGAAFSILMLFISSFMVPQLTEFVVERLMEMGAVNPNNSADIEQLKQLVETMWWAFIVIGIIVSIISLVFASLLLHGVYNRKPSYILSYFIFGVIVNALDTLFILVIASTQSSAAFTGVFHIAMYSVWLLMVWRTYKKIQSEKLSILYTNDMSGIANPMPPSYPYAVNSKNITNF